MKADYKFGNLAIFIQWFVSNDCKQECIPVGWDRPHPLPQDGPWDRPPPQDGLTNRSKTLNSDQNLEKL